MFTPAQSAAERYEPVFDGLRHMTQGERVAPVRNVTLRRDPVVFHLDDGNLFLATPVVGRAIGAVFVGRGSVSFIPPLAIERAEVQRVLRDSVVDAPISAAAFVFTDSTLAEFERQLSFGPRPAASPRTDVLGDAIDRLVDGGQAFKLVAYGIEATIAKGLGFSAVTTTRLTARRPGATWARFSLFSELDVDSVREEAGRAVSIYRTKKNSDLWVRFDPAPRPGDTLALRVAYHGDLIGYTSIVEEITRQWPGWLKVQTATSLDQWLFVKSSYSWFPRYGEQAADVDMTFHTPKKYRFASIGRPLDTRLEGDVVTSHWTTVRPTDQVCFSLGELDDFKVADPRIPPVTVHTNSEAHRQLNRFFRSVEKQLQGSVFLSRFLSPRSPEEEVGADVANSLAFFTRVYGPPLFDRYYAAEIPFSYGQAFPGLMYLPVWTFQAM